MTGEGNALIHLACRLEQTAADAVWPALRACRDFLVANASADLDQVYLFCSGPEWSFTAEESGLESAKQVLSVSLTDGCEEPGKWTRFSFERFERSENPFLRGEVAQPETPAVSQLRLYLPLIVGSYRAHRSGETFVIAHVAQTLDGRIACHNGQSKWISNRANLVHSHRVRALSDAVVIGAGTVVQDDPELTVRHVSGNNPRRIILSARGTALNLDWDRHVFRDEGSTVICRTTATPQASAAPALLEILREPTDETELIRPQRISAMLAEHGLHVLFVEGGSSTVSFFMEDGAIDLLHLHIAPMVLGSGVSSFTLPAIDHVRDGRRFQMEHFEMDGELLLECRGMSPGTK